LIAGTRTVLLVAGPALCAVVYLLVPESVSYADGTELNLGIGGKVTAGMTAWMAVWWVTEAAPLYVTALLPLILLPLTGQQPISDIATSYGHRIVYLAFGGFVLAAALERWQLHTRFANLVIGVCGSGPRRIIGGFMLSSAALSMWISNTATAMIMLPVAMSVIKAKHADDEARDDFPVCLLLSICYACSIGGIGTLIGTGTNMFFAAYMDGELQRPMGFAEWMAIGVPVVVIFLPIAWFLMTYVIYRLPDSTAAAGGEQRVALNVKPLDRDSSLVLVVFLLCALGWSFLPVIRGWQPLANLTDTGIALMGAFALFVMPARQSDAKFLMDWDTAVRKIPWGILLLIGGGLAMARAVSDYGIGELIVYQMGDISALSRLTMIVSVVAIMVFLTEVSSNIASVTALTPIFAAAAMSAGLDPVELIIPVTVAASFAFMLPAATMTNSVIMGSGLVHGQQMARAGLVLNIAAIIFVSAWFALRG
jgi:sodium-dependent dicarboxylate transporter 2/3/5